MYHYQIRDKKKSCKAKSIKMTQRKTEKFTTQKIKKKMRTVCNINKLFKNRNKI